MSCGFYYQKHISTKNQDLLKTTIISLNAYVNAAIMQYECEASGDPGPKYVFYILLLIRLDNCCTLSFSTFFLFQFFVNNNVF